MNKHPTWPFTYERYNFGFDDFYKVRFVSDWLEFVSGEEVMFLAIRSDIVIALDIKYSKGIKKVKL